jgi:hypothetical protein
MGKEDTYKFEFIKLKNNGENSGRKLRSKGEHTQGSVHPEGKE